MKKAIMIIGAVFTISLIQFASYKTSLYTMQGIINDGIITLKNGYTHVTNGTYKDGQLVTVTLRNVGDDMNLENDTIEKIVVDNQ